jgi:hypothetical protein
VRGDDVFVVGNGFAAFSRNGGKIFEHIDLSAPFPSETLYDQTVIYDQKRDLLVWAHEAINNKGQRRLRIGSAQGQKITDWYFRFREIRPLHFGLGQRDWFDFHDIALGEEFLYLSANVFASPDDDTFEDVKLQGWMIMRIRLDSLASDKEYSDVPESYFVSKVHSFRGVQGAGKTMRWGGHVNLATLRVLTWPEYDELIAQDIAIRPWGGGGRRTAPGPDGKDWLGSTNARITAAWSAGGRTGFAWTAGADMSHRMPYVRAVLLKEKTLQVVDEPDLWSPDYAFAFPAAAPNANGQVGFSVYYGGGKLYPSHAVGRLFLGSEDGPSRWELVPTAVGTSGPDISAWGDFLVVRPHNVERGSWVTCGITLQGGSTREDVEVRYIRFSVGKD